MVLAVWIIYFKLKGSKLLFYHRGKKIIVEIIKENKSLCRAYTWHTSIPFKNLSLYLCPDLLTGQKAKSHSYTTFVWNSNCLGDSHIYWCHHIARDILALRKAINLKCFLAETVYYGLYFYIYLCGIHNENIL